MLDKLNRKGTDHSTLFDCRQVFRFGDMEFERLLYEPESNTLDFKRDQYRFVKATDEDKSELLKDILGFANAWRRSTAYILIGVEEVRGERAKVVGIPPVEHLDDHSVQQFVNSLTNQPVHFHYAAFGFEDKHVGIICVEEQIRPVYLKRNYGKLQKEKVYIRRGSSTDPTKPASPEEIAQMRVSAEHISGTPEVFVKVEPHYHVCGTMRKDKSGTLVAEDREVFAAMVRNQGSRTAFVEVIGLTCGEKRYPGLFSPWTSKETDEARELPPGKSQIFSCFGVKMPEEDLSKLDGMYVQIGSGQEFINKVNMERLVEEWRRERE
jgi:hypothetical protein